MQSCLFVLAWSSTLCMYVCRMNLLALSEKCEKLSRDITAQSKAQCEANGSNMAMFFHSTRSLGPPECQRLIENTLHWHKLIQYKPGIPPKPTISVTARSRRERILPWAFIWAAWKISRSIRAHLFNVTHEKAVLTCFISWYYNVRPVPFQAETLRNVADVAKTGVWWYTDSQLISQDGQRITTVSERSYKLHWEIQ